MDNTNNNSGSNGLNASNNFNNNSVPSSNGNGNPKPLPSYNGGASQISEILREASHPHDSSVSSSDSVSDSTPAFSGMPHSQGGISMPTASSQASSPVPSSKPSTAPLNTASVSSSASTPAPDFSSFKRPEAPTSTPVSTSTSSSASSPHQAGGPSPFASAISKQTMSEYNSSQKKASLAGGSYSHIYMWSILSIVVLALIGGGVYWYLFMGGKDVIFPTQTEQAENLPSNNANNAPINPAPTAPTKPLPVAPRPATNPALNTPVKPVSSGPFSGSDKDLVSQYIRKNINSLSPRKSSAGFTVNDIVFDGPNRAIVSYGNRSVSYSAAINATVTNGVVKITSFTILEK